MSTLQIRKLQSGAFEHVDSIDGSFFLGRFSFKQEFNKAFLVEAYGAKRREYLFTEIEVFNYLGSAETFTNWTDLLNRLVALSYTGIDTNSIPLALTAQGFGDFANSLTNDDAIADADLINFTDVSDTNKQKKTTWSNIKAKLKTYFDTLYQATLVSGTNIKTINGTDVLGSGNIVVSSGGSVDISPKATNLLIVNTGLNGLTNYGHMSTPSLSGGSFVNANGRISGLAVTNMRSTAATIGSFTALTWQNFASLLAKAKAVGFLAIGSSTLNATSRCFAGFYNAAFTLNNINYSTACYAGFLNDTGDANLQFCRTITGGVQVKTDLGIDFPARYTNGQNEYKFLIEIVSATTVNYKIKNIITGVSASGTFTDCAFVGAANLAIAMNNNTTAVQTDLKFHSLIYAENYEF